MSNIAVVVGASGGIGHAVVKRLTDNKNIDKIIAISRNSVSFEDNRVQSMQMQYKDDEIKAFVSDLKTNEQTLSQVYICTGILHDTFTESSTLQPEKKLEDMTEDSLTTYFHINTIVPAMWLKHLVGIMQKKQSAIGIISARVGSISDNRLGGWYGYRSSKAALNMMIKSAAIEYGRRSKGTCLISYHPGTVDTKLSEPFQSNVKPEKLFTPKFTADRFVSICQSSSAEESPRYLDYDEQSIQW